MGYDRGEMLDRFKHSEIGDCERSAGVLLGFQSFVRQFPKKGVYTFHLEPSFQEL